MSDTADELTSNPDTLPANLHIISYVSREFKNRYKSLEISFRNIPGLKHYKIYTEADISSKFIEKLGLNVWSAKKGGGYYAWKPWIINDYLQTLQDGDLLIYVDAGCINNLHRSASRNRLNKYLSMVQDQSKCGMVRHELSGLLEGQYTNKYFWDYMCSRYPGSSETTHYDTNQLLATILYMRKCDWVTNLITEALNILCDNPVVISDIYTQEGEIHRHDQSILSLLYKIRGGDLVISDCIYSRFLNLRDRMIQPFLVAHRKY